MIMYIFLCSDLLKLMIAIMNINLFFHLGQKKGVSLEVKYITLKFRGYSA